MTEKERLDATIRLLHAAVHYIYVLGRMAPSGGLYENGAMQKAADELVATLPAADIEAA